jgi:hypothetical protein
MEVDEESSSETEFFDFAIRPSAGQDESSLWE